jgi:predicted esterase
VNEDGPGILQSQQYVHSLIKEEMDAGIPSERIVLGGFSQGGAMSIFSGLTSSVKIGGIVGLSSWLLLHQSFTTHVPDGNPNNSTPILMGHGDSDPLVRYPLAKDSEDALKKMDYNVTFKTYRSVDVYWSEAQRVSLTSFMQRNGALSVRRGIKRRGRFPRISSTTPEVLMRAPCSQTRVSRQTKMDRNSGGSD